MKILWTIWLIKKICCNAIPFVIAYCIAMMDRTRLWKEWFATRSGCKNCEFLAFLFFIL